VKRLKQRKKQRDQATGRGELAHRVLDLVPDDVERILRGGHLLISVPGCWLPQLEKNSIEADGNGHGCTRFNLQGLGEEGIPVPLMISSPLGLVQRGGKGTRDRQLTDVGFDLGPSWAVQ
jgi:hypothetical protein